MTTLRAMFSTVPNMELRRRKSKKYLKPLVTSTLVARREGRSFLGIPSRAGI